MKENFSDIVVVNNVDGTVQSEAQVLACFSTPENQKKYIVFKSRTGENKDGYVLTMVSELNGNLLSTPNSEHPNEWQNAKGVIKQIIEGQSVEVEEFPSTLQCTAATYSIELGLEPLNVSKLSEYIFANGKQNVFPVEVETTTTNMISEAFEVAPVIPLTNEAENEAEPIVTPVYEAPVAQSVVHSDDPFSKASSWAQAMDARISGLEYTVERLIQENVTLKSALASSNTVAVPTDDIQTNQSQEAYTIKPVGDSSLNQAA